MWALLVSIHAYLPKLEKYGNQAASGHARGNISAGKHYFTAPHKFIRPPFRIIMIHLTRRRLQLEKRRNLATRFFIIINRRRYYIGKTSSSLPCR